jgi:hypothetical protein
MIVTYCNTKLMLWLWQQMITHSTHNQVTMSVVWMAAADQGLTLGFVAMTHTRVPRLSYSIGHQQHIICSGICPPLISLPRFLRHSKIQRYLDRSTRWPWRST